MESEDDVVVSLINEDGSFNLPTGEPQGSGSRVERIPTGIMPLDLNLDGGVLPGTSSIICGYTGDGKSSLVVHISQTAAALGHPVCIYHSQMTAETDYLPRLKAWESGVAFSELYNRVRREAFPLVELVDLRSLPDCRIPIIATKIRMLRAGHERTPVIVVDSLDGLVNDRKQLESLTADLGDLAEAERAVIWATSQANAQVTTVTTDHLRETRGKAFPCSLFIGLGRSREEDEGSDAVLTIAKNRHGRGFQVRVRVDWACQRFSDVTDTYEIPRITDAPTGRQICGPDDNSAGVCDKTADL